jgi:hypothetical protein
MFYEEQLQSVLKFIMDNDIVVALYKGDESYEVDYLFKLNQWEEYTVYNTSFSINDIDSIAFIHNLNPIIKLKS